MLSLNFNNISIDNFTISTENGNETGISLLRLDKLHPEVSGNKWFKLRFYVEDAIAKNKSTIVTFGGAWSNHIVATAAACKLNGLQSIGLIRGEKPARLSDTLKVASEYGMKLIFLSRSDYKLKIIPDELSFQSDKLYIINEGGYGEKGAMGASTIANFYQQDRFTHIVCAVGTGTMLAGLVKSALPSQQITGISVLKNNTDLITASDALLTENEKEKPHEIIHDYHFGGYAKFNPVLIGFMNNFYRQTSIATDFVYTGKLLFGVHDLVKKNYFREGSRIVVIHSGGLQGNNSLARDTLIF
ncbi:MAG: pyridoxal-phosphate dependent enzyme [Bacteroidota bacterium]